MKNKSLRLNIFIYLFIFSILILSFLWLFQVIFLDSYYKYKKTNEVERTVKNIINKYDSNNLYELLDNISYTKGMCIEAIKSNENIYFTNNFNNVCKNQGIDKLKVLQYMNSNFEVGNYANISENDEKNIIYAMKLSDDIYVFITESLIPIDSTVNILSSQLIIVTIIVLFLSLIIAYFISNKISSPIIKINEKSKEMEKGKYNIVFDSNTEIKEIKELEKTLSSTAQELNKTEELRRELMANVSHDLKTPLTMIKAYSEMSRDININDKNKLCENLNIIIDEADRLNILVNDILDLSKIQSNTIKLEYEEFDLIELIKHIIQKFKILEDMEEYKFIFETKYNKLYVNCDKRRIEQVIYNLINNAINYTGDDNKIIISVVEEDYSYKICIKDTGKGIKKKDLMYIWDKYYKTDKLHKRNMVGTGLGLSIVKNILEMHDFKYGVDTSNKGTIFYFKIPK